MAATAAARRLACRAHDGPPCLPAPLRTGRGRRHGGLAADAGEEGRGGPRAGGIRGGGKVEVKRTVCGHCSVGCAVDAVVENGVWVRQEPVFDSPINLGAHCAKGAALREHGHGEYRLKYPMKLVERQVPAHQLGRGADRDQRQDAGAAQGQRPDSIFLVGSSKHNNEQAYLLRKWVVASGAPTTATTRRASVTPPRWPAWPTPGVMVR
jgi:formate dehydrogenase major subunit